MCTYTRVGLSVLSRSRSPGSVNSEHSRRLPVATRTLGILIRLSTSSRPDLDHRPPSPSSSSPPPPPSRSRHRRRIRRLGREDNCRCSPSRRPSRGRSFPRRNEPKRGGGARNGEKEKVYSPFQATSVPLAIRRQRSNNNDARARSTRRNALSRPRRVYRLSPKSELSCLQKRAAWRARQPPVNVDRWTRT